jgi:ubiquinone/menaquinone biosynthesis C-methylase UbiE
MLRTLDKHQTEKPNYGNWVPAKLIYIPGTLTLTFLVLSIVFALPLFVISLLFFLLLLYFAYARYRFSSRGGNIQDKIQSMVLNFLSWDGEGKALDIGCGNAPLTIRMAKKYPNAEVTGIDYWGKSWEYSIGVCKRNAQIEGVAERTIFQKASASALPFEDETFDVAVSNLVFHEVREVRDKKDVIKEALRVVKKGGRFVFQDLFLWKRVYGEIDDLLETIRSWGIKRVEFVATNNSEFIAKALKLPFMVGTIGILHGLK